MTSCCSSCYVPVDKYGRIIEIPEDDVLIPVRTENACPNCGEIGKPVDELTLKSFLSVSLRQIGKTQYLFCRSESCPVVYFSKDGAQTFTVDHVREKVYQKDADADDCFVCYCFQHTVGEVRSASPQAQVEILEGINTGIRAQQCACESRNPQGSCCLGNVREIMRQTEKLGVTTT